AIGLRSRRERLAAPAAVGRAVQDDLLPTVDVARRLADPGAAAGRAARQLLRSPRDLHPALDDVLDQVERALEHVPHDERHRQAAAPRLALESALELLGDARVQPALLTTAVIAHGSPCITS